MLTRYPGALWKPSTNYAKGNQGRKAVVLHIAQGGFDSSITYMQNNGVSSHFIISEGGTIAQLVDIADTAWGNGLAWCDTPEEAARLNATWQGAGWYCPHQHKVSPTWPGLTPGINPNLQTISIEHAGKSGVTRPRAQLAATVRLLAWLAQQCPSLNPYVPGQTLIRHADLDPIDKSFCPGPAFDLAAIAAEANASAAPEAWQRVWARRGVPLDNPAFAIPQLYKWHFLALGGCVEPERYLASGRLSIAVFEHGWIYYVAATNRAYLGPALPPGVAL